MTDFVLVHGGMHGAWCWEHLERELHALGHTTHTPEYPIGDVDAGAALCAASIAAQLVSAPDDVVVVGHSMAGLIIPLLPGLRPIGRLVFLCAALPAIGLSYWNQTRMPNTGPQAGVRVGVKINDRGLMYKDPAEAILSFYHDVEWSRVQECLSNLRPQSLTPLKEVSPIEEWPRVPMDLVYCEEDQASDPVFQRIVGEHLGMRTVALPGGHSPLLSRPRHLASLLDQLVNGSRE